MAQLVLWQFVPVQPGQIPGSMLQPPVSRNFIPQYSPLCFPTQPQPPSPTSNIPFWDYAPLPTHHPSQVLLSEPNLYQDEELSKRKLTPGRERILFMMHTLPVNPKLVGDGDGMTIHVDVSTFSHEAFVLPSEIRNAVIARQNARAVYDFETADALHDTIIEAGYRIIRGPCKDEILTKDYKIRLKGVDAPEMGMSYGKEAKDALTDLIKGMSLKLMVYGKHYYGRLLADVYVGDIFIQEILLKEGHVWHYSFFDQRPELAQWQLVAQAYKKGLWASPNPQSPWDYKRQERERKCSFEYDFSY